MGGATWIQNLPSSHATYPIFARLTSYSVLLTLEQIYKMSFSQQEKHQRKTELERRMVGLPEKKKQEMRRVLDMEEAIRDITFSSLLQTIFYPVNLMFKNIDNDPDLR